MTQRRPIARLRLQPRLEPILAALALVAAAGPAGRAAAQDAPGPEVDAVLPAERPPAAPMLTLPPIPPMGPTAEVEPASVEPVSASESDVPPPSAESARLAAAARDPFWPVNYAPRPHVEQSSGAPQDATGQPPPPEAPPPAPLAWEEATKQLVVSAVMRSNDGRYVARVNGAVTTEGEEVAVVFENRTYRFKVAQIAAGGVTFARADEALQGTP